MTILCSYRHDKTCVNHDTKCEDCEFNVPVQPTFVFQDCNREEGPCGQEFSPRCASCSNNKKAISILGVRSVQRVHAFKSCFDFQIGGSHYRKKKRDVALFCMENKYDFAEAAVIKYSDRHQDKNGAEDIKKAMHYLQMILEVKYKIKSEVTYDVQTT